MNKNIVRYLLVFSFFVILGGGVAQAQVQFNMPPGWEPQSPPDPSIRALFNVKNPQGVVMAELYYFVESLPGPMSLQDYFSAFQANSLQVGFSGYTPVSTQDTTVANLSALRHDFTFVVEGANNQLKGSAYFFLVGNEAQVLLFDCLTSNFDTFQPQFQTIINQLVVGGTSSPTLPPASSPALPLLAPSASPSTALSLPSLSATPTTTCPPDTYCDPKGEFTVPLPAGSTLTQTVEGGAIYQAPQGGQITILQFPDEMGLQNVISQIVAGKTPQGTVDVEAQGKKGKISVYSSTNPDTGKDFASVAATYEGTTLLIVIVVPAEEYNNAQGWIVSTVSGVKFTI